MKREHRIDRVLCTLNFHRKVAPGKLTAVIRNPRPAALHAPRGPHRVWDCEITITFNGLTHIRNATQVNWLNAFLLALDYVRSFIPDGEEQDWVDDEGLEVWCVLPRSIPFSWGYELYAEIAGMSDEAEGRVIERAERRRLASEARGRPKDE